MPQGWRLPARPRLQQLHGPLTRLAAIPKLAPLIMDAPVAGENLIQRFILAIDQGVKRLAGHPGGDIAARQTAPPAERRMKCPGRLIGSLGQHRDIAARVFFEPGLEPGVDLAPGSRQISQISFPGMNSLPELAFLPPERLQMRIFRQ